MTTCVEGLAWSPDSQWVLVLTDQSAVKLENVQDGSIVPLVSIHDFVQLAVAR